MARKGLFEKVSFELKAEESGRASSHMGFFGESIPSRVIMPCKLGEHQEPTVTGTKRTKGKQEGRGHRVDEGQVTCL